MIFDGSNKAYDFGTFPQKRKKKKKKVENTHTNTGRKRTMDFSPFVRKRDVLDNALFPPLVDDLEDIFFN